MRVALLHYSFPPVIGGVERILEKHTQLLASNGHEVTAICGTGEATFHLKGVQGSDTSIDASRIQLTLIPELAASHPRVKTVQAELSKGNATGEFTALRDWLITRLRPLFAAHDIVVLHNVCTMPFHMALTATVWQLAEEIRATRFICWIHDLAAINPDYTVPAYSPWNLLRQASDHLEYVAVSELRRRQMVELTGIAPERCEVIPNGLDPAKELGLSTNVERLTDTLDLLDRDLVLFHPTRLLRRKNVELSLHVLAALKAQNQRACLLITGAPDPHNVDSKVYGNTLLSLREELDIQKECYFLGDLFEVQDEDVSSLYRVADALFFPSRQEGFGIPMLEAALHRIPAFCPDTEPLSTLPGAIPFSLSDSPTEIASMIIRQTQTRAANSPRKAVVRNYAWSVIYRNCLAPLLNRHKELIHP